jgi:hypothetical protein
MVDEHENPFQMVGMEGLLYSIVDRVVVPSNIQVGDYLLSWRWDSEQSPQIWQNCADVLVVDSGYVQV